MPRWSYSINLDVASGSCAPCLVGRTASALKSPRNIPSLPRWSCCIGLAVTSGSYAPCLVGPPLYLRILRSLTTYVTNRDLILHALLHVGCRTFAEEEQRREFPNGAPGMAVGDLWPLKWQLTLRLWSGNRCSTEAGAITYGVRLCTESAPGFRTVRPVPCWSHCIDRRGYWNPTFSASIV